MPPLIEYRNVTVTRGDRLVLDGITLSIGLGEHVAILDAIIASDGDRAEALSRDHISRAAKIFVQRLQAQQAASEQEMRQRRTRRIR